MVAGTPPPPPRWRRCRRSPGVPVPVITRRKFRTGGFTAAHLRGARLLGWKVLSSLVVHCRRLAEAKEPLVVAYYDGLDWVAHRYGLRDTFFPAELGGVDDLVGDLLTALPRGAALLVTGDHGHVHLEDRLPLDGLADMVDGYAGDARFRYLYARPGAAADLEAAAKEQFGDDAWVLSRTRLIDEGGWDRTPRRPMWRTASATSSWPPAGQSPSSIPPTPSRQNCRAPTEA